MNALEEVEGRLAVSVLKGHLLAERCDGSGGWFGRSDIVQCFAKPLTVLLTVCDAAKLAVSQYPKSSDLFAAIQTAHDKVPCVLLTIPQTNRKIAGII